MSGNPASVNPVSPGKAEPVLTPPKTETTATKTEESRLFTIYFYYWVF